MFTVLRHRCRNWQKTACWSRMQNFSGHFPDSFEFFSGRVDTLSGGKAVQYPGSQRRGNLSVSTESSFYSGVLTHFVLLPCQSTVQLRNFVAILVFEFGRAAQNYLRRPVWLGRIPCFRLIPVAFSTVNTTWGRARRGQHRCTRRSEHLATRFLRCTCFTILAVLAVLFCWTC